jgi:Zn-finger nucleic acid-binding protein
VHVCPRCRAEVHALLRPQLDIVICARCWDLLLMIAAGGADEVDAR